jgi:hypothetical protein
VKGKTQQQQGQQQGQQQQGQQQQGSINQSSSGQQQQLEGDSTVSSIGLIYLVMDLITVLSRVVNEGSIAILVLITVLNIIM